MHPFMKVIEGICPLCDHPLVPCQERTGCERAVCPNPEHPQLQGHAVTHFWTFEMVAYGCCRHGPIDRPGDPIVKQVIPQRVHTHE